MNRFIPIIRTDRKREINKYKNLNYFIADEKEYRLIDRIRTLQPKCTFDFGVEANNREIYFYIIKDGSGVGTVSYVTGKCSATGTLNTLQAKEGYSLQYLYYMLKVFNFETYKTGMAIPHIYFKDYGKAKIFCPSYTKQLKYVGLLSAIDNKLSAEQSILTDLRLQKQYLLRQMFI